MSERAIEYAERAVQAVKDADPIYTASYVVDRPIEVRRIELLLEKQAELEATVEFYVRQNRYLSDVIKRLSEQVVVMGTAIAELQKDSHA